jgi:hypothetical protein
MRHFVGNECSIPYNIDVIFVLCFSIINLVSVLIYIELIFLKL